MTEVVAGIFVRHARILLAQRRVDQDFPLTWECPGGKVERGEVHHDALRREWEEELGLRLGSIDPSPAWRGTFSNPVGREDRASITLYFYAIRSADGEPSSREGQGLGWFSPEEVEHLWGAPALAAARHSVLSHVPRGKHVIVRGLRGPNNDPERRLEILEGVVRNTFRDLENILLRFRRDVVTVLPEEDR